MSKDSLASFCFKVKAVSTYIRPMSRRIAIIRNPTAGQRRERQFRAILEALSARGLTPRILETTCRGDAERIARDIDGAEIDVLAVAGGDGTINEALNGMVARPDGAPTPALGVLPLGTANVLAIELGLPADPAGLARVLAEAPPREIALGLADGRCFSMMAGAGLDAHVVERVDPALKRVVGKGAYAVEALRQLAAPQTGPYVVTLEDGRRWEVGAVIVAKSRFYGGRFVCAPNARLSDPRLHVCLFPGIGRWRAMRYAAGLTLGFLHRLRDYAVIPATRVRVEGPEGEPVQCDGDLTGRLPLDVAVAPRRVKALSWDEV